MSKKNFNILLVILFCVCASATTLGQNNQRKTLENKRKALIQEINRTNGLVKKTNKTLTSRLASYKLLKSKKNKITQVIQTIAQEKKIIDRSIHQFELQIKEQDEHLAKLKSSYSKGVVSSYKHQKSINPLSFLLTSDSFNSALRKMTFLRKINSYRKQQAKSIRKLIQQLNQSRQEQVKEREAKNILLQEQKKIQDDLKASEQEISVAIASLKEEKTELTKLLQKQQQEQAALKAKIKSLIAKEIARKKAMAKPTVTEKEKTVHKKNKAKEYSETPVAKKLSNKFALNKGKLPWPLERGVVVGSIGEYRDDVLPGIKRERDGVDIRTESNAKVKAIFDGKVISLTTIPGFNKVVILSHGKYFTVYGRLQDVNVQVGDAVKVGDRLGILEEKDGISELHLQLWHKQEKLNPKVWLKK